jgi:hypothetical protein
MDDRSRSNRHDDILPSMMKHRPFPRVLTLLWASLQLAAPGLSSIADGQLSVNDAFRNTTHIEATTSDSCPVVHSLDCALCQFLSTSGANDAASPSLQWQLGAARARVLTVSADPGCGVIALPHGRAPPTV